MLGELVFYLVGFSLVWGTPNWIPLALWNPRYSPIFEHFRVVFGLVRNVQTDFFIGMITHQPYDPLIIYEPLEAQTTVVVIAACLLLLVVRTARSTDASIQQLG